MLLRTTSMARAVALAALVTFALAIAQTTLGGRIAVWNVSPDLLLVWTMCLGLLAGPEAGAATGFASGALQGSLGQSLIGPLGISKTISGLAAGLLARRLFRDNWVVPAVCAVLVTVLNEAIFLLLCGLTNGPQAGRIIAVRAVYHAVLAPPCYAVTARGRRALRAGPKPVV
jgi:rod shape-determining protein MreD